MNRSLAVLAAALSVALTSPVAGVAAEAEGAAGDVAALEPMRRVVIGKSVGSLRIGMGYRRLPGRVRSERFPENDHGGCIGGPGTASLVDTYADTRLAWIRDVHGGFSLLGAATWRPGDRDARGFVIGRARFGQVRRGYPKALVDERADEGTGARFALGNRSIQVYASRGYEAGASVVYWFRGSRLAALETWISGC